FKDCLSAEDLDEMNIEIIRNTLYKSYLEDFYRFSQSFGGPTAEIMSEILQVSNNNDKIKMMFIKISKYIYIYIYNLYIINPYLINPYLICYFSLYPSMLYVYNFY